MNLRVANSTDFPGSLRIFMSKTLGILFACTYQICSLFSWQARSRAHNTIKLGVSRFLMSYKPLLLEYAEEVEDSTGLQVEDALLNPSREGVAEVFVTNASG